MFGLSLKVVNEILSRPVSVGVPAYLGFASVVWALIQRVNSSLGVPGSGRRLLTELSVAAVVPLVVFALRPLRWHFIYRSIAREVRWFRGKQVKILVGVGPGGAIIAGMVAKLMAEQDGREPEIAVIDRVYGEDEYNDLQVDLAAASRRLNLDRTDVGVVVVTSEIHGGDTIAKVCEELRKRDINAPVFSYLWSPESKRRPRGDSDRFVLRTNQRGILPWPDAPAKGGGS